jgi:hypothetical protein
MTGASFGTWLAVAVFVDRETALAAFAGMIGPLAVAVGSWLLMERIFSRNPDRLTTWMVAAFGGKMVFFGAYVGVALGVLSLRSMPFVVSFASYFIALHMTEALCLRRLFAGDVRMNDSLTTNRR